MIIKEPSYLPLTSSTTTQEFCKIYQQFFPFGNPAHFALQIFNTFDMNQNGLIEFKEFVVALSVTARGSLEEKLHCKSMVLYLL